MEDRRWHRGPVVALAVVVFAALVAQIAVAGVENTGERRAATSANATKQLKKQLKKLKRRVAALEAAARQPGPQGPQGPAGTPPGCQGNDAGDVMVAAGSVCIDRYEASVWSSPTGGTQYGVSSDDYPCDDDGQNCSGIYARSVAGVTPSRFITWFQAQQALANSGKRLPTNAEWQQAVAGTPDDTGPSTTPCNTRSGSIQSTGASAGCVSDWGANDMVGNLDELVADWMPISTGSPGWGAFSDDYMFLSGASATSPGPGVVYRGGNYIFTDENAGPLAVGGDIFPYDDATGVGFRGAR